MALENRTYYYDAGSGQLSRIVVSATASKVVVDTVSATTLERVDGTPRITLDTADLSSYSGSNKDAKMREFLFKDANDACVWKRICILATEPEAI
jgi:hypothetical protein